MAKCNICFEDLKDPVFTPCIHGFCNECISKWLSEKKQNLRIPCPVCKYDIAELAGPRDESQLYDDDNDPIPPQLLRTAINNVIQQFVPPPPPEPRAVMRGLGIEEMVQPGLPQDLFRHVSGARYVNPYVQRNPINPNIINHLDVNNINNRNIQQPPINPYIINHHLRNIMADGSNTIDELINIINERRGLPQNPQPVRQNDDRPLVISRLVRSAGSRDLRQAAQGTNQSRNN